MFYNSDVKLTALKFIFINKQHRFIRIITVHSIKLYILLLYIV